MGPLFQGTSNFHGKLLQGVGFLEEIRFKVDHMVVEHSLSGITGNEQELRLGPQERKFLRQLPATHIRHHYIRDQEVDG